MTRLWCVADAIVCNGRPLRLESHVTLKTTCFWCTFRALDFFKTRSGVLRRIFNEFRISNFRSLGRKTAKSFFFEKSPTKSAAGRWLHRFTLHSYAHLRSITLCFGDTICMASNSKCSLVSLRWNCWSTPVTFMRSFTNRNSLQISLPQLSEHRNTSPRFPKPWMTGCLEGDFITELFSCVRLMLSSQNKISYIICPMSCM